MRRILTTLHRWFGLFTALFLFIAGATGAIISWDHELDEALNPELFKIPGAGEGPALSPYELADRIEAAEPRAAVQFLPLELEPGHTLVAFMRPRIDPVTGQPYELGFNQIAVDPRSGVIQAKREWGAISLSRANLLPFLYRLHYTLHLPKTRTTDWGMLFMGLVALVWVIDCFIALAISFPSCKVWKRSFAFRFKQGGHRLVFDLHRSGGVWLWGLLLVIAVTGVGMNLDDQVMRPVVSFFSPLTPSPFDGAGEGKHPPIEPRISRQRAVEIASAEAASRGWKGIAGGMFYDVDTGVYGVTFHEPGNSHGDGTLGTPWLYFRGRDGVYAGDEIPGSGSAGDLFLQAQFPLHSGRLFGLPGRIGISILGALIAMLSLTGILIWARRTSRRPARAAEFKPATVGKPAASTQ